MVKNFFTILFIAALGLGSEGASGAESETLPLIADRDWSSKSQLWLARAFISESDWYAERDHIAIAYVIYRRWKLIRRDYKRYPFVEVIRQYCSGLGRFEKLITLRQAWLNDLSLDARRPESWPRDLAWDAYRPLWEAALKRAEDWHLGQYEDPCNGMAMHFGGDMDRPRPYMKKLDCGKTRNNFYAVERYFTTRAKP